MDGQQPWEPQEWLGLWQQWEGHWRVLWQYWQQSWEVMFNHWQLELQQPLQQQFGLWMMHWNSQFESWKQNWRRQWGEWQWWQQLNRQSWKQHQQQWQRWQQLGQFQFNMWEQQGVRHWPRWQLHQLQPQFRAWQNQWNVQWGQWQQWWQLEQRMRQQFELNLWQQDHQLWNANKLLGQTKSIRFIRLTDVLPYKPLTRLFRCDGIDMIKNTAFGCLVADGFVNELFESHKQKLSWAGSISENDLYISEDGCFAYIGREPTEEANDHNKLLDFSQLLIVLLHKYIHNGQMMPSYLREFMDRVAHLADKTGNDLLVSLWILRNHPFLMDPEKWALFVEEYYKWFEATDRDDRRRMIGLHNIDICKNWHIETVRLNFRLILVFWSGRYERIPPTYFTRDPNISEDEDEDGDVYQYTSEDANLAVFQRVVLVHGPEIFKMDSPKAEKEKMFSKFSGLFPLEDMSLRELAYLIAYYFDSFLPSFIEEVYIFTNKHDLPANERKLLEGAVLTYTNRKSSSWRHNRRRLYEVEETPLLHI